MASPLHSRITHHSDPLQAIPSKTLLHKAWIFIYFEPTFDREINQAIKQYIAV